MATISEKLVLQYQAEVASALKRIASLEKGQGKLENKFKSFKKVGMNFQQNLNNIRKFALPVAAAITGIVASVSGLISAYGRQEEAEAKLRGALVATRGAAGLTQKELLKLASEMQRVTKYSDEMIIEAEGLFLTFTQIGKETFPAALSAAADMSAMFGQDLKQSAIQLGTALNDPIAGIGRLKRIGISFTEDQKESIKQFMEQNDIINAQKVILDELQAEFGGVAKEVAKTGTGPLKQFINRLGDLAETFGAAIIPIINDTIAVLGPFVENLIKIFKNESELEKVTKELSKTTQIYSDAVEELNTRSDELTETEKTLLQTRINLAKGQFLSNLRELNKEYEKSNNLVEKNKNRIEELTNQEAVLAKGLLNISERGPEAINSLSKIEKIQFSVAALRLKEIQTELGNLETKSSEAQKAQEEAIQSVVDALQSNITNVESLISLNKDLRDEAIKRYNEILKGQKNINNEIENEIFYTEEQLKLQEEFRRAQLTDVQRRLEDIANERNAFIAAGVAKVDADRYFEKQRTEILKEENQKRIEEEKKRIEEEQKKQERILELNEAADAAFKEASEKRTQIIIEEAQAQEDALIAAQEKYREEFLRTKDTIVNAVDAIVMSFVSTMQQTGDVWAAFQSAGREAIAQVISAFGDQYNILGAAALVPGPTFNPAAAAGYFTVGASAKLLSSVLRSFEYGGKFTATGPTPIIVGDNTARTETVQVTPTGGTNDNNKEDRVIYNEIYINKEKLFSVITKGMKRREILVDSGAISQ